MQKKFLQCLMVIVLLSSIFTAMSPATYASKATQYRAYQNNSPLKEFTTLEQAKKYAQQFDYAHIEKITNKEWIWDNLPKYKVYTNGVSNEQKEFATLKEATAHAAQHKNSYIRQLDNVGWVWDNFTQFEVYQGDTKIEGASFASIEAAKKEAAKWTNAHIIDVSTSEWVWDNISNEQRTLLKQGAKKYEVHYKGQKVTSIINYAFLKEAIMALNNFGEGEIYNSETKAYVFSPAATYDVYAQGSYIRSYASIKKAIEEAKNNYMAEVKIGDALYWSNKPYISVYQNDKFVKLFHSLKSALAYAKTLTNSSVFYGENHKVWSNKDDFIFMGWNGSSSASVINRHIENTQGLDIDSPTWYYLENAKGDLNDSSSADIVKQYANLGIDIIPLVHNQFDPKMTSEFFNSETAQTKFINSLMASLKKINAKGLNLDFEEVSSKDRQKFTAFVKKISEAAHKENLTISIDLLRGDTKWNDQTAYDREEIAKYVDYVIIMSYDQHWRGSSTAGSVAGLKWTEEGINQYLNYGIPRSKLILGIPFYVREWRIDANNKLVDNKAILMKDIDAIIKENNATVTFDAQYGQNKVTYQKDRYTHVFWAETVDTVKSRVELAKKYDLAGVAAWRLGYEQPEVWEAMIKLK